MEENTEYPLTPFLDFATKLDFEVEPGPPGWPGGVERRSSPVAPFAEYTGVGEDNPYVERGHDPA